MRGPRSRAVPERPAEETRGDGTESAGFSGSNVSRTSFFRNYYLRTPGGEAARASRLRHFLTRATLCVSRCVHSTRRSLSGCWAAEPGHPSVFPTRGPRALGRGDGCHVHAAFPATMPPGAAVSRDGAPTRRDTASCPAPRERPRWLQQGASGGGPATRQHLYLTRRGFTNACSGCSGPSTCRASSSSWAMTSREGPCSSEHTGVFISCSRIRYLLSIWQSLASRLEYYRQRGGYLRPDRRGIHDPQVRQAADE